MLLAASASFIAGVTPPIAVRDISERKKAEQKLAQYAYDLEWKTDALEAAKESAEQSKEEAECANRVNQEFATEILEGLGVVRILYQMDGKQ